MSTFLLVTTVIISKFIGVLVRLPAPHSVWQWVIHLYANHYQVDLDEVELPMEEYANLDQFFVRNLKEGARPLGEGIVSPADGVLRNWGKITSDRLPQIKGKSYSITDLVGNSAVADKFVAGTFFNLYLSPRDYHHVHAPFSGVITRVVYRPGRLLPVNDFSMSRVDNLFGSNERVTITIKDANGFESALTMVGALNVGKIVLSFDAELSARISASPFGGIGFEHSYQGEQKSCRKGERLGTFHLGSSVALLFPQGVMESAQIDYTARPVKMGESLQTIIHQAL